MTGVGAEVARVLRLGLRVARLVVLAAFSLRLVVGGVLARLLFLVEVVHVVIIGLGILVHLLH